ncbi:MAG: GTPase Era [Candidatus Poribacteria bacterium]|jgi:GTP-binding protein Era|nr:GTPase Era [Candidatus Poribacteria bacterium]
MNAQENFKSGYVSIIGEPNVGKSTFLNATMGEKIAIVTPKPQTTRNQVRGVVTTDTYQIIFLDTPGILDPKYRLHDWMVKTAYAAAEDADLILYLVDVNQRKTQIELQILERISKIGLRTILVINKIDLIPKDSLLPLIQKYSQKFPFIEIMPISAKLSEGILELKELVVGYLPLGPQYFPEDQISDLPERFFVAETIREKIFLETSKEIPYSTSVVIEQFKERENGKIFISAIVYVERKSQRGILVGKRGEMIKHIGQLARVEIEEFVNSPVFLELRVLVKKDWRRSDRKLKDLGYTP